MLTTHRAGVALLIIGVLIYAYFAARDLNVQAKDKTKPFMTNDYIYYFGAFGAVAGAVIVHKKLLA